MTGKPAVNHQKFPVIPVTGPSIYTSGKPQIYTGTPANPINFLNPTGYPSRNPPIASTVGPTSKKTYPVATFPTHPEFPPKNSPSPTKHEQKSVDAIVQGKNVEIVFITNNSPDDTIKVRREYLKINKQDFKNLQ